MFGAVPIVSNGINICTKKYPCSFFRTNTSTQFCFYNCSDNFSPAAQLGIGLPLFSFIACVMCHVACNANSFRFGGNSLLDMRRSNCIVLYCLSQNTFSALSLMRRLNKRSRSNRKSKGRAQVKGKCWNLNSFTFEYTREIYILFLFQLGRLLIFSLWDYFWYKFPWALPSYLYTVPKWRDIVFCLFVFKYYEIDVRCEANKRRKISNWAFRQFSIKLKEYLKN